MTEEGHVGSTYHPDLVNGVHRGDVLVGLFGANFPFVIRRVAEMSVSDDNPKYTVINVCNVANHELCHDVFQDGAEGVGGDAKPPKWSDSERFGLKDYTIIEEVSTAIWHIPCENAWILWLMAISVLNYPLLASPKIC